MPETTRDVSDDEESPPSNSAEIRGNYIDLKRLLRRLGNSSLVVMIDWLDCREGWTLAVKILDATSRDLHQSVARDLADDELNGPALVERTVEELLVDMSRIDSTHIDIARVFLRAITHPSLLRSLSIGTFVGVIYRVVGGHNGDRGVNLFSRINSRLIKSSPSLLALTVSSLYELLKRERKCLLHDNLPTLLDALETKATQVVASGTEEDDSTTTDLDAVRIQIGMMRRMADNARGRVSTEQPGEHIMPGGVAGRFVQSTFPLEVIIPGGQHDNDFADVTKIQIFPTLDEITSDSAEYLPSTDFTRPHFLTDPVQRHLDVSFRLLRYDIFGPLKEAMGSLLAQPGLATGAWSKKVLAGDIRAHTYTRAGIQHVLVSKTGLEAFMSFAHPPQLCTSSQAEKRRWWDGSSRLEEGNLVCFVSARGEERSFLLFVVTRKNTKDGTEGERDSTLVSEYGFNPSVTVKLASETQANLAMLHRMYLEKQEGLLLELPGLMPDTFVPVLENLQRMMKDGDLSFQRWILPALDPNNQAPTDIPPPAYARRPGFRFSLRSITRKGHAPVSLDPAAADGGVGAQVVAAATGLDRGQSEALMAALMREYVLIQGPPGTGKSYVGVQLVRVLLDHRAAAKMGPIIIM